MKFHIKCVISLLLLTGLSFGAEAGIAGSADISRYIESLDASDGLTVEISRSGANFSHPLKDGTYGILRPGQLYHVDAGEGLTLISHHAGFNMKPLPKKTGDWPFEVTISVDKRPIGGGEIILSAILLVNPQYGNRGFKIVSKANYEASLPLDTQLTPPSAAKSEQSSMSEPLPFDNPTTKQADKNTSPQQSMSLWWTYKIPIILAGLLVALGLLIWSRSRKGAGR
jgi:hypothetical protein